MKPKGPYQDVRVRHVNSQMMVRLRAALVNDGLSVRDWLEKQARATIAAFENRIKYGRRT